MPKVTLEFQLPEELSELAAAIGAQELSLISSSMLEDMRRIRRQNVSDETEELMDKLIKRYAGRLDRLLGEE